MQSINFLAKTVSFPARGFGTTTYRSGGQFGLEVPYETTMEAVSLTMLNTNNHAPRKFWNSWCEHIQSTDTYNMQYYKKFFGTVKISCFDEKDQQDATAKYQVTLHEAWPKTISAIELGWESTELVDFEVDVAYSWWTATGSNGTPSTELRHGEEHGGRGRSRTTNRTPHRPTFRGRGGR